VGVPTSNPPLRRPQISREYLDNHRRDRYVDAVAELFHEFGRGGATVTNVVRLAGTARNSFYEVFGGIEDLVAYAIGVSVQELFVTLSVQEGKGDWPVEVHEAIAGFYGAVAARPLRAELFLIHAPASRIEAGRIAARAGAERFLELLGRGRAEADGRGRRPLPSSAEEYFSGVIVSLAARRIMYPEVQELPGEARGVAALVVGAYLGSEAAGRTLVGEAAQPIAT
jgi:AcrR family transcriptional regulator